MDVPSRLAPVAQGAQPLGQRRLPGAGGPAVAQRAQVLRGIETECGARAETADRPPAAGGEMRLAAVLDQREPAPLRHGGQRGHVCRLAVEMHGQDGGRPRTDPCLDRRRIQGQAYRIYIGEYRARPRHDDGERGECRREGTGDHLVARADPEPAQQQGDGVGAASGPDRVGRAGDPGELVLEGFHLRPKHEPAAVDDPPDGRLDGRGVLTRPKIPERNAPGRHGGGSAAPAPSMYLGRCAR